MDGEPIGAVYPHFTTEYTAISPYFFAALSLYTLLLCEKNEKEKWP
jgi:hypothetical protein